MDLTQQQHDEILKRVQNRINEFLGSDVEKLSKLSELHDEWDAKRKEIEQSLSLTGDEVPSKVGKIVKEIDTTCGELSANCQQVSLTLAEISKATCSTDDVYLLLEGNFDKIGRLTHAHAYLSILDYIEQLSNRMEGYVAGRDVYTARAIDEYRKLCELCVKVNKTSCAHLRTYLVDTLKYWHSILKKDIVEDFVTCMKNVQWPVVSSNNLLSSPSADSLSKFQHGLSRLLQIVIPYP
ncbi:RINT-1 / TIP-1 family [Nesidiocoris tenuis]|uniref:RINT-1 / TIP-1 family n=1 Tax=Nesidiocoris tenuis TaxID=355587 RepID=A0ABN7BBQ8_9HEMI|nr:RINT-1 / TIP-1 family [Nesidiocoris tenuis]